MRLREAKTLAQGHTVGRYWRWGLNRHRRKDIPAIPTPGLGDPQPFSSWQQSWVQEGYRGKAPQRDASLGPANNRCSKQVRVEDGQKWGATPRLCFGWTPCGVLCGQRAPLQRAGEHFEENFASLCSLTIRVEVNWPEGSEPCQPGGVKAEHPGARAPEESGAASHPLCPGLNFQPLLFKVPKRKKGGREGRRCFHASCLICIR